MGLVGRLLHALFLCDHQHAMKVRQGDVLYLDCPDCGHIAEAIARTPRERTRMKKRFPAAKPAKAKRVPKDNVESIDSRRKG
jgi:hypothetical protein